MPWHRRETRGLADGSLRTPLAWVFALLSTLLCLDGPAHFRGRLVLASASLPLRRNRTCATLLDVAVRYDLARPCASAALLLRRPCIPGAAADRTLAVVAPEVRRTAF